MKNFNNPPNTPSPLQEVVTKLERNKMLQLTTDGYRLLEFIQTTEQRDYLAISEHTIDAYSIPVTKIATLAETTHLEDIKTLIETPKEVDIDIEIEPEVVSELILNENHSKWLGTILRPIDIFDASIKELQVRNGHSAKEIDSDKKEQFLVISNAQTGTQKIIKIDLASLIFNGSVEVSEESSEKVFSSGDMLSTNSINFLCGDYIDALVKSVGLDPKNCGLRTNKGVEILDTTSYNFEGLISIWRSDSYGERASYNYQKEKVDAEVVLELAQQKLSGLLADYALQQTDGSQGLSDGSWDLVPLRTVDELIDDLVNFSATKNYSLGVKNTYSGAGNYGVAFYLMDENNNIGQQISHGNCFRQSAEDAWAYLVNKH